MTRQPPVRVACERRGRSGSRAPCARTTAIRSVRSARRVRGRRPGAADAMARVAGRARRRARGPAAGRARVPSHDRRQRVREPDRRVRPRSSCRRSRSTAVEARAGWLDQVRARRPSRSRVNDGETLRGHRSGDEAFTAAKSSSGSSLTGWTLEGDAIRKQDTFKGFPEAIAFVNRLAPEAEPADHHPDILINYKRVTLTYSTHSEGGDRQGLRGRTAADAAEKNV